MDFGVSRGCTRWRFRVIDPQTPEVPRFAVFDNSPSAEDNSGVAAKDLDRLAEVGQISWCPEGDQWSDLGASPSQLTVEPDEARVERDRPNPSYGLNGVLLTPECRLCRNGQILIPVGTGRAHGRSGASSLFHGFWLPRCADGSLE